MLKRKLNEFPTASHLRAAAAKCQDNDEKTTAVELSPLFNVPLWKRFYDIECELSEKLKKLKHPSKLEFIYNPVEYAADIHCKYLKQFLKGPKRLVFVGMNPGANGMGQNGIPFGNINSVRNFMKLDGNVEQPSKVHPSRPITGMMCNKEEPSGDRMWTLFRDLAGGSLNTFAEQCFVHNFCPLLFFDKSGKNITPNEIQGDYKVQLRDTCLESLDELLELLQPEVVVAVGRYVNDVLNRSSRCEEFKILYLPHPSPRALNNHNWCQKAEKILIDENLIRYIRNE